jgi:hypothetical protein
MESPIPDLAQSELNTPASSFSETLVSNENIEAVLKRDKTRHDALVPDLRREMAQNIAKARWTDWAKKKVL